MGCTTTIPVLHKNPPPPRARNDDHTSREFYYCSDAKRWEIAMAIFMTIADLSRISLGSKGNVTGNGGTFLWSCALAVPVLVGHGFFLRLQSYVYVTTSFIF